MHDGNYENELGRRRYGACHRCGWRGPVIKVHFTERMFQPSMRGYGRLCRECRVQLLHGHVPHLHALKARRLSEHGTESHRHVA
jgi:hypothetical protein